MDVDRGQLICPSLKNVAVVMDLHELTPVGGRPASGRDWRRFERFAEVREDFPNRPGLHDEGDELDVAAITRALEPLPTSLMPGQLLRDLTAQQAADLLAYLQPLR